MNWVNFCNGFIQAANDQAVSSGIACTPAGTPRTVLVKEFEATASIVLALQPEMAEVAGIELASAIIGRAFPCS
jgi:hypothetical protein